VTLAACAWSSCRQCVAAGYAVDGTRNVFTDKQGRQRLWHGVNVVSKEQPFLPYVTEQDAAMLLSMGASVVRLGVMMPGMYPSGPVLNVTYLDEVEKIVDFLHDRGLATILDLHQDVLAPKICGEGTPDWMLDVASLHAMPLPFPAGLEEVDVDPSTGHPKSCAPMGLLKAIGWSMWYMTDQCGKAFAQLYDGEGPMAQAFASYWRDVARRFKGHPGVLAYELLNEPWLGDHVKDPLLLLEAGRAEKLHVSKYMQRMHDIVKAADPDALIFYAPAEVNNRAMRRVGYEEGFLPEAAMAYHVYCVVGTDSEGPTTTFLKELCHFNDGFTLKQRQDDIARLRTAGFVTEFGGVGASATGLAEVEFVLAHFDAMQPPTSWAFWDIGEVTRQNASSKAAYMKVLARPYPRAVAGVLHTIHFDTVTGAFEMSYTADATASTEVVLAQQLNYPSGHTVNISPAGALEVHETTYGLELMATTHGKQTIHVKVAPKGVAQGDILQV